MPRQSHMPRYGFTLVEMSIVLVIIGLLVGGLAGMRSYTRSAAISAMMNDGKFYINAYNQFVNRYGTPPGDLTTASSMWSGAIGSPDVDGNGLIRATTTAGGDGNRTEMLAAWQHLARAGFIPGAYTGATVGGVGTFNFRIGTNAPGTKLDKVVFLFEHPDYDDGVPDGFIEAGNTHPLYFLGQYPNVLRISGLYDADTGVPARGFLTPKQAKQLDEKHDDGKPGTGMIVTPHNSGLANCATSDVPSSADYATAADAKNCWLLQKIQ